MELIPHCRQSAPKGHGHEPVEGFHVVAGTGSAFNDIAANSRDFSLIDNVRYVQLFILQQVLTCL